MNSPGIRFYLSLGAGLLAHGLFAEVGEFTLSENVLNQIAVISQETAPFTKKGRLVTPDISVQVSPRLLDSHDKIGVSLGVDLSGSSRSRSYTPVTRRKGVTAVVNANVRAHFDQEVFFDGEKLETGKLRGNTQIQPTQIGVSNNFGLLNGVVNRKARQQAGGQVQSELPQERRDLEKKVQDDIQKGLRSAQGHLRMITDQATTIFSTAHDLPFDYQFSSKTGGPLGGIRLQLTSKGSEKERALKPDFNLKDQIASSGIFHEDLLTETISKEIAGKEMKLSEFKAYLCSETISSLINFCDDEIPLGSLGLSVIFDEKNPISFKFEDGKVSIKINAKNRVAVNPVKDASSRLFGEPQAPRNGHVEMEPYQVNITYKLKNGQAKLEKLNVSSDSAPLLDLPNRRNEENHAGDSGATRLWKRVTEAGQKLVGSATRTAIEHEFRKVFKETIDFPTLSIPTKVRVVQEKTEVLEAGSMIPLEVKSENGWLAVSASFCHEKTKPLGVTFTEDNRVQTIEPGSPAALVGFRPGDQIQSFTGVEERTYALGTEIQTFIDFIGQKASEKNSEKRVVELSGKSASGIPFTRKVALCPNYINHRKEAEATLAASKVPKE